MFDILLHIKILISLSDRRSIYSKNTCVNQVIQSCSVEQRINLLKIDFSVYPCAHK